MNADHALVFDNEAAQALVDPRHPKHRGVMGFVAAHATRARRQRTGLALLLPTVVRVEAGLDRRATTTTALGRLRVRDVVLDSGRADRAVGLRRLAPGSLVDACVAEAAASEAASVTVLTADLTDLPALLAAASSSSQVHRV